MLSLQPGSYLVTFELAGFAPVKQGPVTFLVGQDLEIGVVLQVAGISSEVTVSGVPARGSHQTQVSSYVTGRQIDSLPVNGRTLNDFVLLTPGVVSSGTTGFGGGTSSQNLSVGGTASTQTAQNIDGANADDQFYAAPRNDYSQEAVQEFQVITNSFPAEFGRASGGVVNIYLKSGTNTFKGGGWILQGRRVGCDRQHHQVAWSRQPAVLPPAVGRIGRRPDQEEQDVFLCHRRVAELRAHDSDLVGCGHRRRARPLYRIRQHHGGRQVHRSSRQKPITILATTVS